MYVASNVYTFKLKCSLSSSLSITNSSMQFTLFRNKSILQHKGISCSSILRQHSSVKVKEFVQCVFIP